MVHKTDQKVNGGMPMKENGVSHRADFGIHKYVGTEDWLKQVDRELAEKEREMSKLELEQEKSELERNAQDELRERISELEDQKEALEFHLADVEEKYKTPEHREPEPEQTPSEPIMPKIKEGVATAVNVGKTIGGDIVAGEKAFESFLESRTKKKGEK